MKVKQSYVSPQYHQVYFTFSINEMKEIYDSVLRNHGLSEREAKRQKKYVIELVMTKIEDELIEEELAKIDVIPVCSRKFRYLTDINPNNPLLVICQFCILPADIQLKFPTKIPKEIFNIPYENEVINDFTQQILLINDEFEYQDVENADKRSIVKYDLSYTKDDFVISEINDQIINLDDYEQPDRKKFLNCKVGDIIILDEDEEVTIKAKVKEIRKKVVKKLTNEVVESLNFLQTKTVSEFNDKIKNIFTFSTTVVILINYLADFVMQTGEITFDDYVINHFLDSELTPKKKKDVDSYVNEIKREIIKEYIIWVINFNYSDDEVLFMDKIIEEYEFDKILFNNPTRIDSYQEYINRHIYEVRVLEYCLEHNIIDLEI